LWAPRAPILADNGSVLSSEQPGGVEIGVQGSFIKDPAYLEASLLRAGATSSEASTAIAAARASPDTFEPVFAVSTARYGELKATLYPIPGTVFHALSSGTAPPADLSAVVGTLGPITRRQLAALGPPYSATSVVGEGGIEQAEQAALAGSPGGAVTIETSAGHVLATLLRQPPVAPPPLRTSIDPEIQQLATEALSGQQGEAALVAIKASTGQVVAAVNTPALSTEDLALDGEQPPGSTFKVITSTALILHGLTPQSPATCPPSVTVDGEVLHNASPSDAASDMLQAFTVSCNTAYIGLAMANLGDSSLRDAAHLYGLGEMAPLGAVAFPGSVPVAISQTDLAASAIGQGRIVVNPLDLASVAASLDSGTVRAPRLVAGATADKTPTRKLPGDIVSDLHQMMASVVESGTAAGTGLPPGTYAKTGTAEYGTAPPLPVDGWLMGFYGNIAFAMVVIDAHGDGGPVDGPIVARFLDSLSTRGLVAAG
ncbi:MAG: penicillin-binding transpeptidase domain-containing protein, partial [Acidimicrobiales bacterium]